MHTFNDSLGRTWTVTITVDAIRRVRSLLDINLLDAIEGKLIERLVVDQVLLCDILFALVQPEAQAKSITDEELRSVPSSAGDGISPKLCCAAYQTTRTSEIPSSCKSESSRLGAVGEYSAGENGGWHAGRSAASRRCGPQRSLGPRGTPPKTPPRIPNASSRKPNTAG